MVADRADGSIVHARFDRLPELLQAGDLVVINVSATLPAAVAGRRSDGGPVRVHFATRAPELDESWRVVELRSDGRVATRARARRRDDRARRRRVTRAGGAIRVGLAIAVGAV